MISRVCLLLSVCIFISACSTPEIKVNLPTARMDLPEVSQDVYKIRVGALNSNYHRVTLRQSNYESFEDLEPEEAEFNATESRRRKRFMIDGAVTVKPKLELALRTGQSEVNLSRIKYQWLGDSYDTSGPGNFSLATSFGFGLTSDEANDEFSIAYKEQLFQSRLKWRYNGWSGKYRNKAFDTAIVGGYRLSKDLLLYGGLYLTEYEMKMRVNYSVRYEGQDIDTLGSYSTEQKGRHKGLNVGFEFRSINRTAGYSVIVEASRNQLSWDTLSTNYNNFIQTGLYFVF